MSPVGRGRFPDHYPQILHAIPHEFMTDAVEHDSRRRGARYQKTMHSRLQNIPLAAHIQSEFWLKNIVSKDTKLKPAVKVRDADPQTASPRSALGNACTNHTTITDKNTTRQDSPTATVSPAVQMTDSRCLLRFSQRVDRLRVSP